MSRWLLLALLAAALLATPTDPRPVCARDRDRDTRSICCCAVDSRGTTCCGRADVCPGIIDGCFCR